MTAEFLRRLDVMKYEVFPLIDTDLARTADLLDQYHDTRLDYVDASIVTAAERLSIIRILTLDQRDFRLVRPRHTESLELLPQTQASHLVAQPGTRSRKNQSGSA